MGIHDPNFYAAAQHQRTEAERRSTAVRKKLLDSGLEVDGPASPEESLLIGQWMNAGHSSVPVPIEDQDQYHPSSEFSSRGRDSDFG
jgi:hypothetical protein